MTTTKMSEVIQHIRKAVLMQDGAGLTDRQLLECFISSREEAAIAALVRRHGSMVWAVCHRVLHNHHDAEDAFQATFLVLLRKAASLESKDLFANWLYGVAHQTALKAKQIAARRRGRERQVMDMPEPKGVEQRRSHDLQLILNEELSRLPDKYRAVIVLCDLQGKTYKEAARQLGVAQSQNLADLRTLNIDSTQITDAAVKVLSESSYLTKLVSLSLRNTRLTDLGIRTVALSPNLSQLEWLNLGGTRITDVGLAALVQSSRLPRLRKLWLYNTRVNLPEQIIGTYNAPAIFRYFRESRLGGPLLEVKVSILGMGALGKSLLLRHLSGDKGAFQQNAPSTHAFEVRTISLPVVHTEQDHQCSIRLFDFGGQRELHGAHRFFLADKRNVYVIVVSARLTREENRLDYWLQMVKHCGGDAPVVVVVTHCDAEQGAIRAHSRDRILPPLNADELSSQHYLFVQVVDDSGPAATNAILP